MEIVVPFLYIVPLSCFILYGLVHRIEPAERQALLKIVLAAFALRIVMASMFALLPSTRVFHEDAEGYEGVARVMALDWLGQGPPILIPREQNQGYYYVCAAIYYVVGNYGVAAPYVNCLLGSIVVLLVYRLTRLFFAPVVARQAAVLTAFIPSMILWNSIALKDTTVTLLIVVALYSCVLLKRQFSLFAFAGTMAPVIAIQPIRFYMIYFLGFAILTSLLIERGVSALTGVPKQMLIAGGALALLVLVGFAGSAQAGMESLSFEQVSSFRHGMATTANSGFAADIDVSTPGRALAFMPLGATMLLFSPFPWQFTSMRAAFAAPEMFIWWALLPSLWRGLRYVLKYRLAECSPMLLFTVTLTGGYSLMQGNIGSGFRQRAQIFVFLFIFTSLGYYLKRCKDRGIDPGVLLNSPTAATRPVAATGRKMIGVRS